MDIKISKNGRACIACEQSFEHEAPYVSLVRMENQLLIREDYCAACGNTEHTRQAFASWTAKYYDPKMEEQAPPESFSPLRQLFYEAVESPDRTELAKAYLAAQLLRRQKVFRLIKESEDTDEGIRVALFSDRIGNRLIEVRDPHLTYAELEHGRQAFMEHLNTLENPTSTEGTEENVPAEQS